MSKWRRLAIELFPEYNRGSWAFQRPWMTIYQVFFELKSDLNPKIESGDVDWLKKVFSYCEWCFAQRNRNSDIWNAAATAFLEHLADEDVRAKLIPLWIKPDMFQDLWSEFKERRERCGEGKAQALLDAYNQFNGTEFEL